MRMVKFLVAGSGGTYQLLNEKNHGLSLDVVENSPDNGASVQTYLPNGTTAQNGILLKY